MTTNTSHYRRSVQITASDEYVRRRMTSDLAEGIWRSPEPTEEQQPVLGLLRLRPARRGAAFPEGESGIPYISAKDHATISAWFKQNLPPLLSEWT